MSWAVWPCFPRLGVPYFAIFQTSREAQLTFGVQRRNDIVLLEVVLRQRINNVNNEPVQFWLHRVEPKSASELREKRTQHMQARSNWGWHLDEMCVKINSEQHCRCRAVDHEGEVLESYVKKTWD